MANFGANFGLNLGPNSNDFGSEYGANFAGVTGPQRAKTTFDFFAMTSI
jgi:hypothetical protein